MNEQERIIEIVEDIGRMNKNNQELHDKQKRIISLLMEQKELLKEAVEELVQALEVDHLTEEGKKFMIEKHKYLLEIEE